MSSYFSPDRDFLYFPPLLSICPLTSKHAQTHRVLKENYIREEGLETSVALRATPNAIAALGGILQSGLGGATACVIYQVRAAN